MKLFSSQAGRLAHFSDLLPVLLSAALLTVIFPACSWDFLAWVALVPLILQFYRSGYWKSFFSALVCGGGFYACLLGWTLRIDAMTLPRFLVFGLYLAAYFGAFALLAKYFHGRFPDWDCLTLPSLWTALEFLKCNLGFLALPPGVLGYSQFRVLPVAWIAQYAGVYGVSFAIVAVNAALASLIWNLRLLPSGARNLPRVPLFLLGGLFLLFATSLVSSPAGQGVAGRTLDIAVIQGNAGGTEEPGNEKFLREVYPLYQKLTLAAAASGASLIVWPEASVPGVLSLDRKLAGLVGGLARRSRAHLLVGSGGLDKFNAEQVRSRRLATSAFLFSDSGAITGRYDKVHLLPFAEYLPARDYIDWPSWIAGPEKKDVYPGKELKLFQTDRSRFGVQICFENLFPDQFRHLVARGADFVIGLNDDMWTSSAAAKYQLLAFCVFRAIENQVPVIRTATNGVSCAIAADGRIISSVKDGSGQEINVAGVARAQLSLGSGRSFYNRFGDLFCLVCIAFLAVMATLGLVKKPVSVIFEQLQLSGAQMIKKLKNACCLLVPLFILLLTATEATAGDAEVLPKGNFGFNVDYRHYLPWDKRFDKNGNEQDVASDFNTRLDSGIFPDLAFFDGLVPGTPNLGTGVVSFKYKQERVDATLAYGVTDRLSVGVKIPYLWYKNEVKARLDTSNANIGKNPAFDPGQPVSGTNPSLIPTALGGEPLSTADIQSLLGDGLFINGGLAVTGFGFKPIETWEKEGLGDIEAGMKYQYYRSDNWRLAGLAGALFPTGALDDPDNLVDQPLGCGSYGLLFRSYNDFTAIRNLVLNGSAFYTVTLPQKTTRRLVSDPHQPLTREKERVRIDPGDVLELEASARYAFDDLPPLAGLSVEMLYLYTRYFKSRVTRSNGEHVPGLEEETDAYEHMYLARLCYSTIPLFLKKEFPVPMDLSLTYRDRFAGNNSTFKTQYVRASLTVYF